MSDLRFRLTVDIAYFANGTDKQILKGILRDLIHHADNMGILTRGLDAKVDWWDLIELRDITLEVSDLDPAAEGLEEA